MCNTKGAFDASFKEKHHQQTTSVEIFLDLAETFS